MRKLFIAFVIILLVGCLAVIAQQKETDNDKKKADAATVLTMKPEYTFTVRLGGPLSKIPLEKLAGLRPPSDKAKDKFKAKGKRIMAAGDLPAAWDWREHGYTADIRDQGACGSCWAFSLNTMSEGVAEWKHGNNVDFSEQYLMDCNEDHYGCNGGFFDALDRYVQFGYVDEACRPYLAADSYCKCECPHDYALEDWWPIDDTMGQPTTEEIKHAIMQYGPVSCAVYVDQFFQYYSGGIFNHNSNKTPNHAIVLFGWNDDGGYWLLQNSWGTGWGEDGLMRIKYGVCGIGYWTVYCTNIIKQQRPADNDCEDSCQGMSGTSLCLMGALAFGVFLTGRKDKRRTK